MTDPEGVASTEAPPLEIVWGPFPQARPTPSHGLTGPANRPPRQVSTVQSLDQVRRFPGHDLRTPAEARTWAAEVCRVWHVPHRVIDSLTLIVSELTTNAITHASGPDISVGVSLTALEVWVIVVDQGPHRRLQPQQAAADDAHGRGLFLVDALASRFEATPAGDGTAVRACLLLPGSHQDTAAPTIHTPTPDGSAPHPLEDAIDAARSHN